MSGSQDSNHDLEKKPASTLPVEGFLAHYAEAYPKLTSVAAGVLGCRDGAEDVVQQAVGIAISKRSRFASAQHFVSWMASTVRKTALNQRRKQQRRRTYATDPGDLAQVEMAPAAPEQFPIDPSTGSLRTDQTSFEDGVTSALRQLSDEARSCLLLRTVHELSYAEISELLGIPPGTAMSHVHRSRKHVRQHLSNYSDLSNSQPTPAND